MKSFKLSLILLFFAVFGVSTNSFGMELRKLYSIDVTGSEITSRLREIRKGKYLLVCTSGNKLLIHKNEGKDKGKLIYKLSSRRYELSDCERFLWVIGSATATLFDLDKLRHWVFTGPGKEAYSFGIKSIRSEFFSPNGKYLCVHLEKSFLLINLEARTEDKKEEVLIVCLPLCGASRFSSDSKYLFFISDKLGMCIDIEASRKRTARSRAKYFPHLHFVFPVAFCKNEGVFFRVSQNSKYFVLRSKNNYLNFFDMGLCRKKSEEENSIIQLEKEYGSIKEALVLSFSDNVSHFTSTNGDYIAAVNKSKLTLIDMSKEGKLSDNILFDDLDCRSFEFSPNGKYLWVDVSYKFSKLLDLTKKGKNKADDRLLFSFSGYRVAEVDFLRNSELLYFRVRVIGESIFLRKSHHRIIDLTKKGSLKDKTILLLKNCKISFSGDKRYMSCCSKGEIYDLYDGCKLIFKSKSNEFIGSFLGNRLIK